MQSSLASFHFCLLSPNLPSTLFSNTLNLRSTLSVKDKVSHQIMPVRSVTFSLVIGFASKRIGCAINERRVY
jgi:hypothetical protein